MHPMIAKVKKYRILRLKRAFSINLVSWLMRNPFKRSDYPYGSARKRITPEGEPLEGGGGGGGTSRSLVRIIIPIIIGIIIISIIAVSSVRIVYAGNRVVLVQFGIVDTDT